MENINQTQQSTNKFCAFWKKRSISNRINMIAVFIGVLALLLNVLTTFRPFDKEKIIVEGANELEILQNWGNLVYRSKIRLF